MYTCIYMFTQVYPSINMYTVSSINMYTQVNMYTEVYMLFHNNRLVIQRKQLFFCRSILFFPPSFFSRSLENLWTYTQCTSPFFTFFKRHFFNYLTFTRTTSFLQLPWRRALLLAWHGDVTNLDWNAIAWLGQNSWLIWFRLNERCPAVFTNVMGPTFSGLGIEEMQLIDFSPLFPKITERWGHSLASWSVC